MSRSSDLLELRGAIAAGLFSKKGFLEEFEGDFHIREASVLAEMCAAVTHTMEMQALLLARLTAEPGWMGCYGWAMWGPDKSIVAVDDNMYVLNTAEASFNEVLAVMRAEQNKETRSE